MTHFTASNIQQIDPAVITCCNYHRDYFIRIQKVAGYFCTIYDHVLSIASERLDKQGIPVKDARLLDFGCGLGLLGVYAKRNGWQQVSLMDINEHCTQNASTLAKAWQVPDLRIQKGSEDAVAEFFKEVPLPHVVISLDVIEHVYDIRQMLAHFKATMPEATLYFTTGAIAENPLRYRAIKKLQRTDEHDCTDELQTFSNNPFAGWSFRAMRRKIIQTADIKKCLSDSEIDLLITHTRGQHQADILQSVNTYLQTGALPPLLAHPTNTCDPISSSWTERLLTVKEYHEIFSDCGYNLSVHAGAYNDITHTGIKKGCLKLLNLLVKTFNLPQYSAYLLLEAAPR